MSKKIDSPEYYYSRSSSEKNTRPAKLPGIRDTLGDVLDQPARPEYGYGRESHINSYHTSTTDHHEHYPNHGTSSLRSTHFYGGRGSHTDDTTSHHMHTMESSRTPVPVYGGQKTPQGPQSVYAVYKPTDHGLIEQSGRRTRPKEDPSRRYVCDNPGCEERFDRPSSLEIHKRSHSGEKPYICDQCGKGFTVKSNMRRHERTHGATSAFEDVEEETGGETFQNDGDESAGPSYGYSRRGSSNNQKTNSAYNPPQFYSSSRRK
ncbi:hypothetical protein K439DRAFT_1619910 [Ramaria rubella]|nr:hypothetical protein K439DRAFT_1619910 [Ramaria rubella]